MRRSTVVVARRSVRPTGCWLAIGRAPALTDRGVPGEDGWTRGFGLGCCSQARATLRLRASTAAPARRCRATARPANPSSATTRSRRLGARQTAECSGGRFSTSEVENQGVESAANGQQALHLGGHEGRTRRERCGREPEHRPALDLQLVLAEPVVFEDAGRAEVDAVTVDLEGYLFLGVGVVELGQHLV